MIEVAAVQLLLVDDHALVRDGLRLRLGAEPGLEVMGEAESTASALSWLRMREHQGLPLPDLILTDLSMKGSDGLALIGQVHEQWPQIACMVLSMHDHVEYITQALRAGARGYLVKDGPAHEIAVAVTAVMAGQTWFSARIMARLAQAGTSVALLTQRERDVLRQIGDGLSSKQIAQKLYVSVRTIETHRCNIRRKLALDGQAELVKYAVEHRDLFEGGGTVP